MKDNVNIVITSISAPNEIMTGIAEECKQRDYKFIVIGDVPSPSDFEIDGCDFYSIDDQVKTGFEFASKCPLRHYSRKNIGYLIAIKNGATIIVETDDDNMPYDTFWRLPERYKTEKVIEKSGWVNMYNYFTDEKIWPRGFPLEEVSKKIKSFESLDARKMDCPIQQGLADANPDVDAIYRLIMPLPQMFRKDRQVILAKGALCPFNSQNTVWFSDAFALLYLPSYCSFRMTDIWRGLIAQRIAHVNDWGVLFYEPTVTQDRNEHNLMRDFKDEIPGFLNNAQICRELERLDLVPGVDKIGDNLRLCYKKLVEMNLVQPDELSLLDTWLESVNEMLDSRQ
ncbi:MAG: DUF288 domain-containing protein [Sedimentisphaerales bacterium]|nr:DUF288 domain-containing protein [Sedimentisphaerales bacterium]